MTSLILHLARQLFLILLSSTGRQLVPRPRRPQSVTPVAASTPTSVTAASAPPLARRQQSRRRPHKYIEVYSRPPTKPALAAATSTATSSSTFSTPASKRRSGAVAAYDYYDENGLPQQRRSLAKSKPKVIVHGRGIIECLEQGNFPHPLSCRKFISCAKFEETGGIVGWEYTCPKGLGYDGDSGTCTWTAANDSGSGRACRV